jgi:DMSO/TMAO reductase YedYZ molybdopterin-dependent catalytic subunit
VIASSEQSRVVTRPAAAMIGVVAAGLGLGTAEFLGGVSNRPTTPVLAVGDAVIEASPSWLTDWAISTFGTANKTILIAGVLVVLAIAAAGIGVLASYRRLAGAGAASMLGVVAVFAVVRQPETGLTDALIAVAAGAVAVGVLWFLTDRAQSVAGGVGDGATGEPSRRRFLQLLGAAAAVAVGAGGVGRLLGSRRREVEESRAQVAAPNALPRELPSADPPDGVDLAVDGAQPWRTPNPDFYRIDTALSPPLVHPDDWRLRVHGMVDREVVLDFDDLVALGLVDRWVTLTCVSNQVGGDLVGNALWTGVRVADVLGMAGPLADADAVLSTSHDGWDCGTPLEALVDGRDSLFAVAMNGEPLPVEHGFPVRMVVPGLYGYVSATKWVVDLEVSRFDRFTAYWTSRGWAEKGPIKVQSRIDVPGNGTTVPAGTVAVAGVAWAQHRGIEQVEVRVDRGEWQSAELAEAPTPDTWRQWVWQWDAAPGSHSLEVRAATSDGEIQTGELAAPAPDGATGWHAIQVTVSS